ncbi:MAG TPA: phospholipase D-like domain-containing protein [Flavobacterium sp.]|uniref:phospholipase D-like domain-containing protein n=1 Tax=Flavobacterium sp. TaxID=239 RepID=UPI002DBC6FED|nr:phospholipase D-like domain-containing protein [Flavobacterium sp.]HEU4789668.1 phospholipase D-like domain-containing protein [Flavobacterium sp.]
MQEQEIQTSNYCLNNICKEKTTLVHSGEDYFLRARNIILNAQSVIHIQMYIFENDATGQEIINALQEAAIRNVKIYVLLDGYGSYPFPRLIMKELKQLGINIRFFSPFFSSNNFYIGRRLHHKIITADGTIALIGGINISDKYRGTSTEHPWLDYAIEVENGETVMQLEQLCQNIYFKHKRTHRINLQPISYLDKKTTVTVLQNDWLKRNNEIAIAYVKSIQKAQKEVVIVGCYFLPGRKFSKVLKKTAKSGVKIKLILSGISDIPLMQRAIYHLYSSLLQNNIELYEWNKSILHGKVALVDNKWATIGSFNLNHLSSYGSIETNVAIESTKFAKTLASDLNAVISQCERITLETIKRKSSLFATIANWLSYHFVRTTLIIITYIPYNRFMNKYKEEN